MAGFGDFPEIGVELDGPIALVEVQRPPHNFFSLEMIASLADAYEALDKDTDTRVIVLASEGRSFCAGAQLGGASGEGEPPPPGDKRGRRHLYYEAVRLFETELPVVAAVQGAAIGATIGGHEAGAAAISAGSRGGWA